MTHSRSFRFLAVCFTYYLVLATSPSMASEPEPETEAEQEPDASYQDNVRLICDLAGATIQSTFNETLYIRGLAAAIQYNVEENNISIENGTLANIFFRRKRAILGADSTAFPIIGVRVYTIIRAFPIESVTLASNLEVALRSGLLTSSLIAEGLDVSSVGISQLIALGIAYAVPAETYSKNGTPIKRSLGATPLPLDGDASSQPAPASIGAGYRFAKKEEVDVRIVGAGVAGGCLLLAITLYFLCRARPKVYNAKAKSIKVSSRSSVK